MSADSTLIVALAFLLMAAALAAGVALQFRNLVQLKRSLHQAQTPATPTSPGWQAVPGQRIELGATGWVIQLRISLGYPPYSLFNPEGVLAALGNDLAAIKKTAEQFAADRAQFETPPDQAVQALMRRVAGAPRR